jgi:hypothetical protein
MRSSCGFFARRIFQQRSLFDDDGVGAARLLGGFAGDAAPAFDARRGRLREMLLCAPRDHRNDALDSQLSGFLDGPLHPVELEDRQQAT